MLHFEIEKGICDMNIENGIEMPDNLGRRGRDAKYPFSKMEIGQSVFFEGEKTNGKPYVAARVYGGRVNKKFAGRAVDGGIRIWRTA